MFKNLALIIVVFTILFSAGCAGYYGSAPLAQSDYVLNSDLVSVSYRISDMLLAQSKIRIGQSDPVLVASFVNINNLQESSTLGRMLAEQVSSRLSQLGYRVIDMRLRTKSVFMEEGKGEFLLSRDLQEVGRKHNASAVIVGTYGETMGGIYVSARIVNPQNSTIISSCDYAVALGTRELTILTRSK